MRVRIVCYEELSSWILGKFARRLADELTSLSVAVDIAQTPDDGADINHHIIYLGYDGRKHGIDTLMVTHIDSIGKMNSLRMQLDAAAAAVCMSSHMVRTLVQAGLPAAKLCHILPAHDGVVKPKPTVIGITTRIYGDGRKREGLLVQAAKRLNPADFAFRIMGGGWETIVAQLRSAGFAVEYFSDFDPAVYQELIPNLDYYLYLGNDEGSIGFVDAVAAGVPTIATPQGFHLDVPGGLTFPFESEADLYEVLRSIAEQKAGRSRAVEAWTWRNYALKHLHLWDYLLTGSRSVGTSYQDGLASLGCSPDGAVRSRDTFRVFLNLLRGSFRNIRGNLSGRADPNQRRG